VQQIIKLCFGLTKIAKHYFIIDPDGYFTKNFDKNCLYYNGQLKFSFHECWHNARTAEKMIEMNEVGHGDKNLIETGVSFFNGQQAIKLLLKNTDDSFRNYVASPNVFDSTVIHSMKLYLQKNGLQNFSNIIRIMPFEFQWYGEYLNTYFTLIPMPYMFLICEPSVAKWTVKKGYDQDPNKYGIQYQSVDYEKDNVNDRVRPIIVIDDK